MKNFDTNNNEERELTAKEQNRKAQFERLLAASAEARAIREMMINEAKSAAQALFLEGQPLNYFILKYVYTPAAEGTTDFKKFNEWKKEGYTIIKGSKAFPVWSQPTKREKKEEDGDTPRTAAAVSLMEDAPGTEGDKTRYERERFNMCYLFSNLQVTRREPAAADDEETAPAMVAAAMAHPEPIEVF